MGNFFKKVACFSDIHWGRRGDSEVHNDDCLQYIDWFCEQVLEHKCDKIFFLGDWFDNQVRIRIDTQWYANTALRKLKKLKVPIYVLVGNHDLFFKRNRTVHSLDHINDDPDINLINEITTIDGTSFLPFLVGEEFVRIPEIQSKYIFGHLELPLFLTNQVKEMEDHGGLHADHFLYQDYVFSGHFHKRQLKVNKHNVSVCYIGNGFGLDMNDVNDFEKGCMILEWGGQPQFLNYDVGPKFIRTNLSLLDDSVFTHGNNTTIEILNDIDLSLEEIQGMKTELSEFFRQIHIRNIKSETVVNKLVTETMENQSIEEMVEENLARFDVRNTAIRPQKLLSIFKGNQK